MLEKEFFMPLEYFKKTTYSGSCQGMRFSIGKHEEEENKSLRVTIWEGPFAKEKCNPETMYDSDFPFSGEGISQAVDYVNKQYEKDKERWDNIPFWTPDMAAAYEEKQKKELSSN